MLSAIAILNQRLLPSRAGNYGLHFVSHRYHSARNHSRLATRLGPWQLVRVIAITVAYSCAFLAPAHRSNYAIVL